MDAAEALYPGTQPGTARHDKALPDQLLGR